MPDNEYVPTDIITRIKAVRLHLHLSQQQFADLTNVPVTLFKQWENGSIHPPDSYWQRILLIETSKSQTPSHNGTIHEPGAAYSTHTDNEETFPTDFLADPDVVRTFVEGQRLAYGHLFNPAFATEISLIEPLPHQRIAVYDHMLQQSRLRFFGR